jgi:hypothetical protein
MPAFTYGDVWRTVRLYCPSAPTFLAREWVNVAWKQLLAARRWGFMRGELTLVCDGLLPFVTLPPDFASFLAVVDESRQLRLCTTPAAEAVLAGDPTLSATGPPVLLMAARPSTDPLTLGQALYRVYPNGAATLTAIYNRQGARLDDTSVLPGILADGGEVLIAGALAQAALWPGTGDKSNPYFNAGLAQAKADEFKYGVQMLSLRDDEQYPSDLWDSWPYADCSCLSSSGDLRTTDACA